VAEAQQRYPKRLIEVDLPIRKISEHARREKSIRHGHISTLHIWWARRPLAACRAVILGALWPDPADPACPERFRSEAARLLRALRDARGGPPRNWENPLELRQALLDFIGDFANWDLSNERAYLETSRHLVAVAHEGLGGAPGTRPLVIDPFAGGGAIPLEALRVGAEAFASDLNPVAVLLNKVVLELVPTHGPRLADEVRRWGEWVRAEAEKELGAFYPKDPDGAVPIAYLWARTVRCEGPGCGAEVPLLRSLWLAKKGNRSKALRLMPHRKAGRVDFEIVDVRNARDVGEGTVKRGSATCPLCGFTTKVDRVRAQLSERHGGAADARLLAVVTTRPGEQGRHYRLPTKRDLEAVARAAEELARRRKAHRGPLPLVPEEPFPQGESRAFTPGIYGVRTWGELFTPRQLLALTTLVRLVREAGERCAKESGPELGKAVATCLAMAVDRQADYLSSLTVWAFGGEFVAHTFGRQALPIVWDFPEVAPLAETSGNWTGAVDWVCRIVEANSLALDRAVDVQQSSATSHPLPDDAAHALVTDPPYYDAVPYADLSDFFYVWLRRTVGDQYPELFATPLTPKAGECVVNPAALSGGGPPKDRAHFERTMRDALAEARRVVRPDGVGIVVFAHKSTAGWEAQLQAMIDAGWTITASWPIDTERPGRLRAQNSAALASSIHIVCRPREHPDGSLRSDTVGDWRAVLAELPQRLHEWLPRLAQEGIVGADAIFACLGPALEIYSRYSRVEKVSGETVTLREYLEHVWAAVSREALTMLFEGAETQGLEPDARLTAMWLWTLASGANGASAADTDADGDAEGNDEDDETAGKSGDRGGFVLEFDAARKIAQGLGAKLEELGHVVEVKGEKARLLDVVERTKYLFGKVEGAPKAKRTAKKKQMTLFGELEEAAEAQGWGEVGAPKAGTTTLDRVHQAMLLFGSGRAEALKRFLVEEGVGKQTQFWKLAQSLSALYPSGSDEKRWVDGVLARKKGLGFG
jgi:adenine-specific DNA methylase